MVRPSDEDFHDERTTYMQINDLSRLPERTYDDDAIGFTYVDFTDDEGTPYVRRGLIQESTASLTAYVGVPTGHLLANCDYDDFPLDVHGGLTFAGEGEGQYRPAGWYWYGWNYAHLGDYTKLDRKYYGGDRTGHDWTIPEVLEHLNDAMRQLRILMEENS